MIELVMDFPVIFLKVLNIQIHTVEKKFVLLFEVSSSFFSYPLNIFVSNIALGWDKEKYVIIGHSYGSILGMTVESFIRNHL